MSRLSRIPALAAAAALSAATLLAPVGASAATVDIGVSNGGWQRITLRNVSSVDLNFSLVTNGGTYSNAGGYVKWSTMQNGRADGSPTYDTCYECGFSGGDWSLVYDYWNPTGTRTTTNLPISFGSVLDTVYVWVKSTYGVTNISYDDGVAALPTTDPSTPVVVQPDVPVPAVPVPAAVLMLGTALAALGGASLRRRRG